MPLPRVDTPERHAAIFSSEDLALVKSTARRHRMSVRRLRWRVAGRICFALQDLGDRYADWGRHGYVYLHEDGTLDVEASTIYGHQPDDAAHLARAIATDSIAGKVYLRRRPETAPPPDPISVAVARRTTVEIEVSVIDGIVGDLAIEAAAVPLIVDEVIIDHATREVEIVVTETYLPDLAAVVAADPPPPWIATEPLPDHRRRNSWVEFLVGLTLAVASFPPLIAALTWPSIGWTLTFAVPLALGVPLVADAIRRHDALGPARDRHLIQGKELEWISS